MAFCMAVRSAVVCSGERVGSTMTTRYLTSDVCAASLQSALAEQWPPQL